MKYAYFDVGYAVAEGIYSLGTTFNMQSSGAPWVHEIHNRMFRTTYCQGDPMTWDVDPHVAAVVRRLAEQFLGMLPDMTRAYVRFEADVATPTMTFDDWLDSVTIHESGTGSNAETRLIENRVARERYMSRAALTDEQVLELAAEAMPEADFTITLGRYSIVSLLGAISEDAVPEQHRRFLRELEPSRIELGEERRDLVSHLDDEGNLVVTQGVYIEGFPAYIRDSIRGTFGGTLDEIVADARETYRQRVLNRIRRATLEEDERRERLLREKREKTAGNFERFRQATRNKRDEVMHIPTLPFVPNGVKASRNWGIEVETGAGRDLRGTPSAWDAKGDGSLESAYDDYPGYEYIDPEDCEEYDHREEIEAEVDVTDPETGEVTGTEWTMVENPDYRDPDYCRYCGEVERDYYDDDGDGDCVELVSPILTSMHSRGLNQICEDLEHSPRTDSAGIHVHVEAKDLTGAQIQQLVMSYDHIEFLIEASYDRVSRGYCKRRSAGELIEVARSAKVAKDLRSIRKGDRYVTVNLQSLDYHGTVEFRAMGPRYNYDHLVRWAMFCREMVNCAKNGATSKHFAKVKTWDDVLAIFAKYGSEYRLAAGLAEPEIMAVADDMMVSV